MILLNFKQIMLFHNFLNIYSTFVLQDAIRESEAIAGFIKELRGLESSETVELSNKALLLAEEMKTLVRIISTHVESLTPYVDFLRSADEVLQLCNLLSDCGHYVSLLQ